MEHCGVHRYGQDALRGMPPQAAAFVVRAQFLDAVVREVAEHGYAAASVAGITERAGVEGAAFFDFFTDKQDALLQAYDLAAAFVVPRVLEAFRRADDWASGARAALATYLAILDADHAWARACLRELGVSGPGAVEARDAVRNPVLEALQRSAPVPAAVQVVPLVDAVDAVALDAMRDGSEGSLRERQAELVHMLLAPVLGPPRPGAARGAEAMPSPCRVVSVAPVSVVDDLDRPGAQLVLGALVRDAAAHRDGPALWQIVELLEARRASGGSVPAELERDALEGLQHAWAFGLTPLYA